MKKYNGNPWFNPEIKKTIKLRNLARKHLFKNPSIAHRNNFKKLKT